MKKDFKSAFVCYSGGVLIGNGGSANVYKVFSNYQNTPFALKLLHEKNSDKLARFRNEFAFLANTIHENIVHIVDSGMSDDGTPFYIMPIADKTLRDCIKSNNCILTVLFYENIIQGFKLGIK